GAAARRLPIPATSSSRRAQRAPPTPTSAAATTTSRSNGAVGGASGRKVIGRTEQEAPRPAHGRPPQVLLLLQDEGRRDRLQERRRAPALHLRARQDPFPPHQRGVPPPPASGRGGDQAGPRDGAPAVRRGRTRGARRRSLARAR